MPLVLASRLVHGPERLAPKFIQRIFQCLKIFTYETLTPSSRLAHGPARLAHAVPHAWLT